MSITVRIELYVIFITVPFAGYFLAFGGGFSGDQVASMEISELVNSSVKLTERSGELFSTILPDIKKTAELIDEISNASAEQNLGIDQINSGMIQLNDATQQNAAFSEELSSTSDVLYKNSKELEEAVEFFRI